MTVADEPQSAKEALPRTSFMKQLSNAAAKKALAPLAATAATAGAGYLTRKSTEVWQERVLPKLREKGGVKGVAKEALEKIADRLGGRGSEALSGLVKRLDAEPRSEEPHGPQRSSAKPSDEQPQAAEPSAPQADKKREQERRQREKRRQQRQRALERSRPT